MELRSLRGTRNWPVTVAPFRAWRGSRGIVAQSPKFHRSSVARKNFHAQLLRQSSIANRRTEANALPLAKSSASAAELRPALANPEHARPVSLNAPLDSVPSACRELRFRCATMETIREFSFRSVSMKPFCRSVLPLRHFFLVLLLALACSRSFSQTGPSSQTPTPALSRLPAVWETQLREIAARIVSFVPPPARVSLVVNNVSSLDPADVAAVGNALKSQLASAGVLLASANPGSIPLQVTLSKGSEGLLLVAQVNGNPQQVAIVSLPPVSASASPNGGVLLDAKLVWEQPTRMLDFGLPAQPGFSRNLLAVLEPQRLVFYSRDLTQWQLLRELSADSATATRDPRGHIELSQDGSSGDVQWNGTECKGDFMRPESVACVPADHSADTRDKSPSPFTLPGGGDALNTGLKCERQPIALATGGGDWTQPDFVQAYELRDAGEGPLASGSAINFNGPVTAIWATSAPGVARAIVRNLQTGNYEAYVVTATCSQ
jgi:hypothetical protein